MDIAKDFEVFCKEIQLDDDEMNTSKGEIAKKLNNYYYGLENEKKEHIISVGSVGRKTAIKGSSDLDLLFVLPSSIYEKYNSYSGNGQSALLQEVKNSLKNRYPNTDIRGDGQVVVIDFSNYSVELVPGFLQENDVFKYPDTNNGGSWKITDPLNEQKACQEANEKSNGIFLDFCHIMRAWKNKQGFEFPGLLIDTLVFNYMDEEDYLDGKEYCDYLEILQGLFDYLKSRDKNQKYWFAPGSNQHVYNKGNGRFVKEAKKAAKQIDETLEEDGDINACLRVILGNTFPKEERSKSFGIIRKYDTSSEQFIEDLFPIDIQYSLKLECKVTQDGFRDDFLSNILRERKMLKRNKKLDFFIERSNFPEDSLIYWKVRNVGSEAIKRKCVRGEIKKTNRTHQIENTNFRGAHYVECFAVRNGVCIARDHIDVPICM